MAALQSAEVTCYEVLDEGHPQVPSKFPAVADESVQAKREAVFEMLLKLPDIKIIKSYRPTWSRSIPL